MDEGRMVDLLLVRLSRDDEKQKVIDLLVSELGMTSEEATEKVENSPSILRENVEMEQGRILQDRMYPFVDLLPKYYKNEETKTDTSPVSEDDAIQHGLYQEDEPPAAPEPEDFEEEDDGIGDIVLGAGAMLEDDFHPEKETESEPMVITSAAEEMITVQRCHICGRTPTNGEKLVPCTACGELTCVDCYNRREHVCEKCASEGKTVDRPLDAPRETETPREPVRAQSEPVRSAPARRASKPRPGTPFGLSPLVLIIAALAAMAVAFYFIDPLNLFSKTEDRDDTIPIAVPDTMITQPPDTVSADTVLVTLPDTTEVQPDSLKPDSTAAELPALSLSDIRVPDSMVTGREYVLPPAVTRGSLNGIEVLSDSMLLLAEPLGQLLEYHSISLDGYSLLHTESGYDLFVLSILHPEPAEKRAALVGSIGALLDSTMVDQMVLYYRENQYYEPNMFSFIADSFSVISQSPSPYFLQGRQGFLPATTDLVTGPVLQWMTELD